MPVSVRVQVNIFDLWDDVTLKARSLVLDISVDLVGRSFPKFHDRNKFSHKPADPTSFIVQMLGYNLQRACDNHTMMRTLHHPRACEL